jgi:hypothetical protein
MFVYLVDGLLEVSTTLLLYLSPSSSLCTMFNLRIPWEELSQGYFT